MYTIKELNNRLNYLSSTFGVNYRSTVTELRTAIQAYFARDSNFEFQVNKTLDKVIADSFHYGLEYENMDLLKSWRNRSTESAPEGYDNVTNLFNGYKVFEEIMQIKDRDFRTAFYGETKYSSGFYETEYHNTYIDDWIKRLNISVNNEMEGLKKIMQYCANRSYNLEWAIIFEELGNYTKHHPVMYYAKDIFVTKG